MKILSRFYAFTVVAILGLVVAVVPARAQYFGGVAGNNTLAITSSNLTFSTATNFTLPGGTNATIANMGNSSQGFYNENNVAFVFGGASTVTNTGTTLTAAVFRSIDGVIWESNNPVCTLAVVLPANSATNVVFTGTNITTGAYQFFTLGYITNSGTAGSGTNMVFKYAIKPGF